MQKLISIFALAGVAACATADIRITEWAYSMPFGEYVEFTNTGSEAIDMTGWSYDDDSRIASPSSSTGSGTTSLDLSPFGLVQPGESVLITEGIAEDFRLEWNLPASVKVIGEYTNNLGRNDEINLFDAGGNLVDRLTYGDQTFPGSIRTQNTSGNPGSPAVVGANDVNGWVFSVVGDIFGSYANRTGTGVGNPGIFIPAPAAAGLLGFAGLLGARRRR